MFVGTEAQIQQQVARVNDLKSKVTDANEHVFTALQDLYAATNELARLCSTK